MGKYYSLGPKNVKRISNSLRFGLSLAIVILIMLNRTEFRSHTDMTSKTTNCLSGAIATSGSVYGKTERPLVFFMETSAFQATFMSVPGDSEMWWSMSSRYPWNGVAETLIFVGELFQRAKAKGIRFPDSSPALIDVGANMGQEVVVAGMLGFQSTTFEILPQSVGTVKLNLKANCVSEDMVTIVNAGVGKSTGSMGIGLTGFSAAKNAAKSPGDFKAQVWSISDYFLKTGPGYVNTSPLLLKLDCETCESGALAGSYEFLRKFPPSYIMVEVVSNNGLLLEQISVLQNELGFSHAFILGCNDRIIHHDTVAAAEKNILAFKNRPFVSSVTILENFCDIVLIHNSAVDLFPN
mmetsp:Transcript_36967/g.89812  ORF Transcript_36967/g.89812 Transcript_36967/m.89812 type:complete len:352 (+) Transcript_36967:157-1212(+)